MLNETKFNFNSAICTSKAQSERLLALGLKKETADMSHTAIVRNHKVEYREDCSTAKGMDIPAWSLHRLIEMMPTMIERHNQLWELSINGDGVIYFRKDTTSLIEAIANNVYDNMISCIEWLIKEGYFNKEYLEESVC